VVKKNCDFSWLWLQGVSEARILTMGVNILAMDF